MFLQASNFQTHRRTTPQFAVEKIHMKHKAHTRMDPVTSLRTWREQKQASNSSEIAKILDLQLR
jgi:hypothetical protein